MTRTAQNISFQNSKDAISHLWNEGASLIPTGKEDGKVRLTKPTIRRLPLSTVLETLQRNGSNAYGICLAKIAVIDIDDKSDELAQLMVKRFGVTPFKVSTPKGLHLYYAYHEKPLINLRSEGYEIDLKVGATSYVVGPYSIRPDGGTYDFIGQNFSLNHLPVIQGNFTTLSKKIAAKSLVPEGERNLTLTKKAREYVGYVNDINELYENLLSHRDQRFENSEGISDNEVWKIADWAWKLRLSNKLYEGQNSMFKIDRAAYSIIYCAPNGRDAWDLYLYLSNKHGHLIGKTFSININGLLNSHPFHFGQRKMASAITFLLKSGYLKVVKKHQAGKHGRLFQLSKPVDVSVASLR